MTHAPLPPASPDAGAAAPAAPRTMTPIRRALGVLGYAIVIAGSIYLGFWFSGGDDGQAPPPPPAALAGGVAILLAALGVVAFLVGAAGYALVLATTAFTFSYRKPCYRGLKVRHWFAKLLVEWLLLGGAALAVSPFVLAVLTRVLPDTIAVPGSFFVPFVALQLLTSWLIPWAPLEPLAARRRARAQGLPPDVIAAGRPMGISDPSRKSSRKLAGLEDDIGLLWLGPGALSYRGDADSFALTPSDVLDVERVVDNGAVSSYFGNVSVVLRFRQADGTERRVRLHPEGRWTMTGVARGSEELAVALNAWRSGLAPQRAFEVTLRPTANVG